ncbi:hypothetical protein C1645_812558 [Glomus cerebriforme]|uniref:Uncharacterized protein n=1 Tax=Glomus cerebriforme TaxID=658196 RepID=A0A397TKQ0_9GLOM|nr:hypothetical protein C1645_812558 [Glomus cerebriforme]
MNYLAKNYDVVIIPEFNVSNMVRQEMRKINSKTVWSMLTWSHYSFRQRLKHKAEEIEYRREKSLQVQGMQCDYGQGCKWSAGDIPSRVA